MHFLNHCTQREDAQNSLHVFSLRGEIVTDAVNV